MLQGSFAEQLMNENERLKLKIIELEARLAQYENAHIPPTLRRGRNRKKDPDRNNRGIAWSKDRALCHGG
jgi:transposase